MESVVVETLAGLLEVSVAPLCGAEACLGEVLPAKGAAAQLPAFGTTPGTLRRRQLDVERQREPPGSEMPGYVPPYHHKPGETQEATL